MTMETTDALTVKNADNAHRTATIVTAVAEPKSSVFRRKKRRRDPRWRVLILSSQLILLVGLLIIWEFGSSFEPGAIIDQYAVSKPSEIWKSLVTYQERGVLWPNIGATLWITLVGFAIGAASGFLAGLILGMNRYLSGVLQPFISAIYSIPRLALVPLFLLWFGIGDGAKIALVVSIVFFLVFYSTFAGVKEVDRELIDRMRLMRATQFDVARKAILPSAMTFIIEGLNISGPMALIATVTAEMFSSNSGVGYLLMRAAGQFDTAGVFACILVLAIMGLSLMGFIRLVEGYVLRWKSSSGQR